MSKKTIQLEEQERVKELKSIAHWQDKMRVPAWKIAMLCQFMHCSVSKQLTQAEMTQALTDIENRAIGQ